MAFLDKITDELFCVKKTLEHVMKNKQSITLDIINEVKSAEPFVERANSLIKQSDYYQETITHNFQFTKEDPSFMLISSFYNDVMSVLEEVNYKLDYFCRKQLDF